MKINITIQITAEQKAWLNEKKKSGISQNMLIQNALAIAMKADQYAIKLTKANPFNEA